MSERAESTTEPDVTGSTATDRQNVGERVEQ